MHKYKYPLWRSFDYFYNARQFRVCIKDFRLNNLFPFMVCLVNIFPSMKFRRHLSTHLLIISVRNVDRNIIVFEKWKYSLLASLYSLKVNKNSTWKFLLNIFSLLTHINLKNYLVSFLEIEYFYNICTITYVTIYHILKVRRVIPTKV